MNSHIKFFLDKPTSEKPTYIFIRYYCKDGDLKYSTQQSILPANWNKESQNTNDRGINSILDRLYLITEKYVDLCRVMNNTLYKVDLIQELNKQVNRLDKPKMSDLFSSFDLIIEEAKSGRLLTPKKRTKYSSGTIKNFQKTKERLFEFNEHLDFGSITIQTYLNFIHFCNERDYMTNYTGSLIKDWKAMMALAYNKKMHKNLIFKDPEFKILTEESFQVYLNEDEIQAIYKLDLSGWPKGYEIVRDRFIVDLYCGLRASDMATLTIDNIKDGILTHINKKTNKRVVMPVHYTINEIIEKYKGDLPYQYHQNVVNRYIKDIAKHAGLTEVMIYTKTVGGVVTSFQKEKWEMITNHTCRRSLTTNLLKSASVQEVMPIMGMSLQTVMLYNKTTAEENAKAMKGNTFFKN